MLVIHYLHFVQAKPCALAPPPIAFGGIGHHKWFSGADPENVQEVCGLHHITDMQGCIQKMRSHWDAQVFATRLVDVDVSGFGTVVSIAVFNFG